MVCLGFEPGGPDGRREQIYWATAVPQRQRRRLIYFEFIIRGTQKMYWVENKSNKKYGGCFDAWLSTQPKSIRIVKDWMGRSSINERMNQPVNNLMKNLLRMKEATQGEEMNNILIIFSGDWI